MSRGLRIVVAALFLIGILALAQGQMARAGGLPHSILGILGQEPPPPGGHAFDFGTGTSPDAPGYTRVTETSAYSASIGFGWISVTGLKSNDVSAVTDDLKRDLVGDTTETRIFRVDLPNGTYTVTVTMGDQDHAHEHMMVKANGTTVLSDVSTAAGNFAVNTFTVNVTGGFLELEFSDPSGGGATWVVNAITIVPFAGGGATGGTGVTVPGQPGTVNAPPIFVPSIATSGTYSVGGVCTFRVIQPLATGFTLKADLLPFTSLGNNPATIVSDLAGVCRAIYNESGVGVVDSLGTNGQVEVCFASVPNTNGVIYVYNPYQTQTGPANPETYTALPTTSDGGLLCAPAQQTGKYFLANAKP
jgi:hypothetical protein